MLGLTKYGSVHLIGTDRYFTSRFRSYEYSTSDFTSGFMSYEYGATYFDTVLYSFRNGNGHTCELEQ